MILYKDYECFPENQTFMTKDEEHVIEACIWMVENDCSIRTTAKNCDFSKSVLHREIHKKCKYLSPDLYIRVVYQIKKNSRKGGKRKCQR